MNPPPNSGVRRGWTSGQPHKFNILVWNAQGAGSRAFLNILREHIHMHRPSIMALVETRISGPKARSVCDSIGFSRNIRVEAHGFQGGIWVLWHEDEVDIEVICTHEQFVTVGIKSHGQVSWILTVIYASPHTQMRDILWQDLQRFAVDCGKPWLLAGDFNETVSLKERNHGGPYMRRRYDRFRQWIENNGLIDLGFSGPKFTWTRVVSRDTRKEARLDRALCNDAWHAKFLEGAVRHLIQACSDHSSLLIATGGFSKLPKPQAPFRFQVVWTSHTQFEQLVTDK